MIQRRNIVVCILLCIVTCGLYNLYWVACMANDVNTVCDRQDDFSGGAVVLFSIITCGIYHLYWLYTAGDKMDAVRQQHGWRTQNSGLVYLLLGLFGFSVISWALLQNDLNAWSDRFYQNQ